MLRAFGFVLMGSEELPKARLLVEHFDLELWSFFAFSSSFPGEFSAESTDKSPVMAFCLVILCFAETKKDVDTS